MEYSVKGASNDYLARRGTMQEEAGGELEEEGTSGPWRTLCKRAPFKVLRGGFVEQLAGIPCAEKSRRLRSFTPCSASSLVLRVHTSSPGRLHLSLSPTPPLQLQRKSTAGPVPCPLESAARSSFEIASWNSAMPVGAQSPSDLTRRERQLTIHGQNVKRLFAHTSRTSHTCSLSIPVKADSEKQTADTLHRQATTA